MAKFNPTNLSGVVDTTANPGTAGTQGAVQDPAAYAKPVGTKPPFLTGKTILLAVVVIAAVAGIGYFIIKRGK